MPDTRLRHADLDRRRYDRPLLGLARDPRGRLLDAQGRRHRQRTQHDQRHRDGHRRPDTPADHDRLNPAAITNQTGATFTFSSNDGGATFEVRLDGGAWIPSTSPKVYSGLSDGPHTFDVRATDAAGNADLSPATFAWTVDTAAPNTTITCSPPTRRAPPAPPSPSPPARAVRASSASSTAAAGPPARRQDLPLAGRRLPHLPGPRHRRGGQHRRLAGQLHLARRRHQPDRLDHRSRRRRARPRHDPACEQLGRRRLRPRVGRLRALARRRRHLDSNARRAGTRRSSPTGTTTCAS